MLIGLDLWPPSVLAGLGAIGALLLALYVLHALRTPAPAIDLRLLKIPTFRAGILGGLFFRIGVGASPFLLPLLLQAGFGQSAFEAGSITLATGIGALAMKTLAPRILARFGFRRSLIVNALLSSAFVAAPALFDANVAGPVMIVVLLIGGFSRSLQFTSISAILYADVERDALSRATTFAAVMQELSGALGVTIAAITLDATHRLLGGAELEASHFPFAFAAIGTVAAFSTLAFLRLPGDAGAALISPAAKRKTPP